MEAPNVFVSHASQDKERFVLGFATKLYSRGIRAWVDRWEMRPGDSLVRKIFDEGIGQAEAVIVVISEYSINKLWVRKELDVSTVRQIEDGIKLIPVIMGNVEKHQIPTSLRDTLWVRINDLNDYDAKLSEVVEAIYGRRTRPPLGPQPEYTRSDLGVVPGLRPADSQILKVCCEMEMQHGTRQMPLEGDRVLEEAERAGLHKEQVVEAMRILDERGYLNATYTNSTLPFLLIVTDQGFDEYAHTFIPGYKALLRSVGLKIVNQDARKSDDLAQSLDSSQVIVEHILALFEFRRWISLFPGRSPGLYISDVSPELRRWLEETGP